MLNPYMALFIGEGIFLPLIFYFTIRRYKPVKSLSPPYFLLFFILSYIMFPLLLPRKHIEFWMVIKNSSFPFVLLVVQMHNNLYEEVGKLVVLLIGFLLIKKNKELISLPPVYLLLGLFVGLSYGIGEAHTLSLIAVKPALSKIFKVNLTLLFITWQWVLERLYAIFMHAILGGLVGLSVYVFKSKRVWGVVIFILALLFHELVDGTFIYIRYFPYRVFSKFVVSHIFDVVLPLQVLFGIAVLLIVYFLVKKRRFNNEVA